MRATHCARGGLRAPFERRVQLGVWCEKIREGEWDAERYREPLGRMLDYPSAFFCSVARFLAEELELELIQPHMA